MVLSYRIVRRTLARGISVGWGVYVGSTFVGGGDAVGVGSEIAHALDSSRIKVTLTVMGLRNFILLSLLKRAGLEKFHAG